MSSINQETNKSNQTEILKSLWIVRHSIRTDSETKTEEIPLDTDCSITNNGVHLAKNFGHLLSYMIYEEKNKNKKNNIDKIYTSPYMRAIQTSYAISSVINNPPIIINSLLSEMIVPSFVNNDVNKLPFYLSNYLINTTKYGYPETEDNVDDRCIQFLEQMKNEHFNIAISVTHGGLINKMVKILCPEYEYQHNLSPSQYIPSFCDYLELQLIKEKDSEYKNEKLIWKIGKSNWLDVKVINKE